MFIPKEVERLMTIYKSVSEKEFAKIIKDDAQAKADMEFTAKWLESELQPFIDTIKGIFRQVMESLEPLVAQISENPGVLNSLNKSLTKENGFSLGA
ncbi:hypothetical protein [Enterococcus wangshanyuanii]|uniref:Uncharacterized protein n=1 Tax=Enterococcus wangshanyuanii TaxID=2005703 RepID=A0ABQ1PYE2_9ENTE|nr:hypothetical protein [Enterococcus wangshanyuanii]GGD06332.1 hypothetical protein GCM10011573_39690 [Enterococcus wangshanyuanii]